MTSPEVLIPLVLLVIILVVLIALVANYFFYKACQNSCRERWHQSLCILSPFSMSQIAREVNNSDQTNNSTIIPMNSQFGYQNSNKSCNIMVTIGPYHILHCFDNKKYNFNEPCTLQATDFPSEGVFFEMMLMSFPLNSYAFIGLGPLDFSRAKIPGLAENTVSFETDKARIFKNGQYFQSTALGNLKEGDVLSVAMTIIKGPQFIYKLWFGRNGIFSKPIDYISHYSIVPTIHVAANCCTQINFKPSDFIYEFRLPDSQFHQKIEPAENLPPYTK